MASKKNNYISAELEWAEAQLATWKEYIDAHPIHLISDRKEMKETKNGGAIYTVVSTIEAQIKSIQEMMTRYLQLLEVINNLREKEEKQQEAKAGGPIPHRMKRS